MRKFGRNILSFICLFILLMFLYETLSSYYIYKRSDFILKKKPTYLVLGHSHPETAFNDSLIRNLSNMAQSGESYFYTFQKVKEILKQNYSIKTVFIEFTNNQLNNEMDNWIWGDKYLNNRYPIYSSFMSLDDHKLLMQNNSEEFYNAFSISSKNKFLRILFNDLDFMKEIGGYKYLIRNKTDSLLVHKMENDKTYNKNPTFFIQPEISETNLLYLTKIIDLCQRLNIRVVLIRSPQHEKYSGYFNEKIYQDILKNNFEHTEFLDLSRFSVSNDEFGDLEHLNYKGARKFSIWFNRLIQEGYLKHPLSQQKINREIEVFNEENKNP